MNAESTAPPRAEIVDEILKWTVGGGMIILALFPLALPILALTALAVLPLLLIAAPAGLLVAAVALPILLVRTLVRRRAPAASSAERGRTPPGRARAGTHSLPPLPGR